MNTEPEKSERGLLDARAVAHHAASDHSEAFAVYERLACIVPPDDLPAYEIVLGRLSNVSYLAGLMTECLLWSKRGIGEVNDPKIKTICYKMAAIASTNLLNDAAAEQFCKEGLDHALEHSLHNDASSIRGMLANLKKKDGKLAEAIALCDQIIAENPAGGRSAWMTKGEAQNLGGDFDAALASFEKALEMVGSRSASSISKLAAIVTLGIVRALMLAERPNEAYFRLNRVASALEQDPKLNLYAHGFYAWIYAAMGRELDSRRKAALVDEGRQGFLNDRNTQQFCLGLPARAMLALKDYEQADRFAELYLATEPSRCDVPFARYVRGICAEQTSKLLDARLQFEVAAESNEELYYSRLSRERLSMLPTD